MIVGEFEVREPTATINDGLHVAIGVFEGYSLHDKSVRQDLQDLKAGSLVLLEMAGKEINEAAVARIVNTVAPLLCARANAMTIRVSGDLIQIIENKL